MKDINRILNGFVWVLQLGFSVATPIVLCLLVGLWLVNRYEVGMWVIFVMIILGLGGAVCSFLSFYKITMRGVKKDEKKDGKSGVYFNDHD